VSLIRGLVDAFDLISAKADEVQDLIIKSRFNRLQESAFEAVIISNYGSGLPSDQALQPGDQHYWYRIRALDGSDDGRPSPYTAPQQIRESKLKIIINSHRTAYWSKSMQSNNDGARIPAHNEVWKCRYTKKGYRGPIVIEHYLRNNNDDMLIISDADADALAASSGVLLGDQVPPTVPDRNLSDLPDNLPFVNYQELSEGLLPMTDYIMSNLSSAVYKYSDFDCGGVGGFENDCTQKVQKQFSPTGMDRIENQGLGVIRASMEKWTAPAPGKPSAGVWGVGAFRIGHGTFNDIRNSFPKVTDNTIFGKFTQRGFAAYILLKKNAVLGGYMLGKHTDVENAAHELSLEWSIFPSQYSGDIDGFYRKRNKSYYADPALGGYVAKLEAKETTRLLESWKNSFQQWLGKKEDPNNNRHLLKTS
jgi:hypothetical protein